MATVPTAAYTYHTCLNDLGYSVAEVNKILAAKHGNVVSVWTVIEGFDRGVRNRLYSAERDLFQEFPTYRFDFHVIEGDRNTDIEDAEVVYVKADTR